MRGADGGHVTCECCSLPINERWCSACATTLTSDLFIVSTACAICIFRSLSPIFGPCLNPPVITREEQRDLYESHTKNCVHCKGALDKALKLKAAAPVAGLAVIALSRSWQMRLAGVGVFALMRFVGSKLERAMTGADRAERTSAAQFAGKNSNKKKQS